MWEERETASNQRILLFSNNVFYPFIGKSLYLYYTHYVTLKCIQFWISVKLFCLVKSFFS